jgi:hypothetical protein
LLKLDPRSNTPLCSHAAVLGGYREPEDFFSIISTHSRTLAPKEESVQLMIGKDTAADLFEGRKISTLGE